MLSQNNNSLAGLHYTAYNTLGQKERKITNDDVVLSPYCYFPSHSISASVVDIIIHIMSSKGVGFEKKRCLNKQDDHVKPNARQSVPKG